MPQGMQVKLLRVLQERQVVRIGARRPVSIDVRLVAATNVDLTRAVETGNFRKDLYYRINVVKLNLPRLCERQGDILPLTRNFMEVYRTKMRMPPISMTLRAEQALLCYSWPGNIRELENVIHYAVITCKLGMIDIDDLKLAHSIPVTVPVQSAEMSEVREESIKAGLDQLQTQFAKLFAQHPPELFSRVEKMLVRAAYDYCAENQVHTARLLGISRNVLRARLKSCGLLPDCTDAAENRDVEPGTRNHLVLLPEQHLLLQKQHLVANTVALPTVRADIRLTGDTVLAA